MIRSMALSDELVPDVCQQIRLLREQQNFSQRALAAASGLSRNTLSLLERGRTSPTLTTLQKVAKALEVDVGSFFLEASRPSPENDEADIESFKSDTVASSDQETFGIEGLISALILRLEPKARCGSLLHHNGEKFIYCLSGRCLFSVDQQRHILEPGDSLHFDGRLPHHCQNPGPETTRALVIFLDIIP